MNTLKQLQEKGEEEFNKWFEQEIILDQEVRTVLQGIKSFLNQQTTLAYNAGKADILDTVLKEIETNYRTDGLKDSQFASIWNQALDTLKNKLLNKEQ